MNKNKQTLNKQINIKAKDIFTFLFISMLLPNALFALSSFQFGFQRSYINLDYFLPCLLLLSHKRVSKIIACSLYAALTLIDAGMLLLEYFPSMNIKDIPYLLGFILSADLVLIVLFFATLFYILVTVYASYRLSKNTKPFASLLITATVIFIHCFIYLAEPYYTTPIKNIITESRIGFLIQNREKNFIKINNADALHSTPWLNATQPWFNALKQNKPLNKKLLLIVAESWGQPNNSAIQDGVLQKLKAQHAHFDFFEQGSHPFLGLTVQAELRELCRLDSNTLDLREVKSGFNNCLPNLLAKRGYKTHAMHNATSFMYGRDNWYKLAGFQRSWFKENLNIARQCVPFDGICDWDMLPKLKQILAQYANIFSYWLTLTAHFYYAESDIHTQRFQCADYKLPKGDACQNLRHQAKFFDNLASIISNPEMRGVEIIIVGDHVPPLFGAQDLVYKRENPTSRKAHVPWIYFRIKD